MADLRGGLIGCGYFARNHMHGWADVPGVEIAAVCDADPDRAAVFGRDFGVSRRYTGAAEMLRTEHLDFVDVVTQPASHRGLVELAASAGVPVICQKPLAPTLEDAVAMVECCSRASVPLMVHENFRWQKPMRALKEAAASIGSLFFGRISFRSAYDVYTNQPYLATERRFIIADLGVHLLDLARFFFGEIADLSCCTQRINPRVQGEDTATILLRTRGGASCIVDLSFSSQLDEDLFPQTLVSLEGAAGSATIGPHFALTTVTNGTISRSDVSPKVYSWSTPPGQMVQESVVEIQRHWTECLRAGAEPETSGEDNLRTLELVYGAYESAERIERYRVKGTR